MPKPKPEVLELAGREVSISNPGKPYFPALGLTKLDVVRYYLSVAEAALRGVRDRPLILKRYPDGIEAEPFFQKRAPDKRPDWVRTATFAYPSGRSADEVVIDDAAGLAYVVNLGCIDLNPHPVRAPDLDHPDELRIDLDPVPGVAWPQLREVAAVVKQVLDDAGLVGWPKTSGSRGIHIWVRIAPRWPFAVVREAALAVAREVERRAPAIATSRWRKEERHGVLIDYNQNARDRTTASAYSVRPTPDARVSMPLTWAQLATCDPAAYTIATVPELLAAHGDAHAEIDAHAGSIEPLLALAEGQEKRAPAAKRPLLTIAAAKEKKDALAGLERWKARHPDVVPHLAAKDVIVDTNRGRSSAWYRIRINLESVPEALRPAQEPPDPDYDPRSEWISP